MPWAAAGLWLAGCVLAGRRYGPDGLAAVHAAGVLPFGVWLCWRHRAGRPPLAGHPGFALPAGLLAIAFGAEDLAKLARVDLPLWWLGVRSAITAWGLVLEWRHIARHGRVLGEAAA